MMNDDDPLWYHRTALIWEPPRRRRSSSYWPSEIFQTTWIDHHHHHHHHHDMNNVDVRHNEKEETEKEYYEICRLSYQQYLYHVMTLAWTLCQTISTTNTTTTTLMNMASSLRHQETETPDIHHHSSHNHPQQRVVITIPIAVAIPEGPWLPIAIAAVHALNLPFPWKSPSSSSSSTTTTNTVVEPTWISVALLPLDPGDGYERLYQMVQQVRPAMILTASRQDQERFQQMIQTMVTREMCHEAETTVVYDDDTTKIRVMDVNTLWNRMEDCASTGTAERIRDILTSLFLENQLDSEGDLPTIWNQFQNAMDSMISQCDSPMMDHPCVTATGATGSDESQRRISHIVFTSGSTGTPKGCVSSIASLQEYIHAKNQTHLIHADAVVLLASAISFDPCMSDVLATLAAHGTLALAPREALLQHPGQVLQSLGITHVLCTPTWWSGVPPMLDYPKLRVVALGGEPIPKSLVRMWKHVANTNENFQLLATYGVTEACVYQTIGAVEWDEKNVATTNINVGQDVGIPFIGIHVRICLETQQDQLIDVETCGYPDGLGEIVLAGAQLDQTSSYFQQTSLSARKFVFDDSSGMTHYRTGDRGYLDQATNHLFVVGRIEGEEGTIKINGIRVELGEIEAALVDDSTEYCVVTGAIAVAVPDCPTTSTVTTTELHAYVVLSDSCLQELDFRDVRIPDEGVLCCDTPLLTLLRERCHQKARVTPSAFVIVPRIPMSATGKRDRRLLPPLQNTLPITEIFVRKEGDRISLPLQSYGKTGSMIVEGISKCLNLQPCQMRILSTTTTFAMLGGDSLTATRLVRALHARHHNVPDSRFIGGNYGVLDGPFSVRHLYRSRNLGEYADWLDAQGICESMENEISESPESVSTKNIPVEHDDPGLAEPIVGLALYEALLQATSLHFVNLAMALLDIGADPNIQESEGRLGKVTDRNTQKKLFRSNPLHLACLHGETRLVEKLISKGARHNVPNASSLFPIHLAAGGDYHKASATHEDDQRLVCVQLLLQAGCPVRIRDGSNQTIVHAAARGGYIKTLDFILTQWCQENRKLSAAKEQSLRDKWDRTPVHWAVLHGHAQVVEILLHNGFCADPLKPKETYRRTSVANESPMEICDRLYDMDPTTYQSIREMLQRNGSSERS